MNAGAEPPAAPEPRLRFYSTALRADQREDYEQALTMEGLEDEIAVLRVKIKEAADAHEGDLRLLTHGITALTRAVAAQYRLSPRARKDLADNLSAVLNSLGDQLLPADR